jgi:hypothetical protein
LYFLIIFILLIPSLLFGGQLQDAAYQAAIKDANIPVIESTNSNDHPRIDEYCKNVGIAKRSPYCAASVYTWYKEGAEKTGLKNPAYRTGATREIYTAALRNPMRYKFIKPRLVRLGAERLELGDIGLIASNSNFTHGHTFMVTRPRDKNTTINIEGNTTSSNIESEQREQNKKSRNKGGVYNGKIRAISDSPNFRTVGWVRFNK